MKILMGILFLTTLALAGCSGTSDERAAKRDVLVEIALDRIERFNALGIDPIQLDDRQLLALDTACVAVLIGGAEFGLDAEVLKTVSAACEVIMKAAARATPFEAPSPVPKPVPDEVSGLSLNSV